MTELRIELNDYGSQLTPRVLGIEIKEHAMDLLEKNTEAVLVFDFSGVLSLSTGFARELFGGLHLELGKEFRERVKLQFGDNDRERLIASTVARGIKAAKAGNELVTPGV